MIEGLRASTILAWREASVCAERVWGEGFVQKDPRLSLYFGREKSSDGWVMGSRSSQRPACLQAPKLGVTVVPSVSLAASPLYGGEPCATWAWPAALSGWSLQLRPLWGGARLSWGGISRGAGHCRVLLNTISIFHI